MSKKKWYSETWTKVTAIVGLLAILVPVVKGVIEIYRDVKVEEKNNYCRTMEELVGIWQQTDKPDDNLNTEDSDSDIDYYFASNLSLNKDSTYSYISKETTTFLGSTKQVWFEETSILEGKWEVSCDVIMYKDIKEIKTDYSYSEGMKEFLQASFNLKTDEEILEFLEKENNNNQEQEIQFVDYQEIIKYNPELFSTDKYVYSRIE